MALLNEHHGAMLEVPEFGEHQVAIMFGGPERAEFFQAAQPLAARAFPVPPW